MLLRVVSQAAYSSAVAKKRCKTGRSPSLERARGGAHARWDVGDHCVRAGELHPGVGVEGLDSKDVTAGPASAATVVSRVADVSRYCHGETVLQKKVPRRQVLSQQVRRVRGRRRAGCWHGPLHAHRSPHQKGRLSEEVRMLALHRRRFSCGSHSEDAEDI